MSFPGMVLRNGRRQKEYKLFQKLKVSLSAIYGTEKNSSNPMPSYVEKVTDTMKKLLWDNLLEEFVIVELPLIPVIGPVFAIPLVNKLTVYFIQEYIAEPLLKVLTRFGIFTSIDWKEGAMYNEYEARAKKLISLQDKEVWNEEDRKAWRDAARALIHFNLKLV